MSSSFSGLYIASSGLFASQRALNVVSHNIANANTVGYSRQRLNLETSTPLSMPTLGMAGTGVTQKSITQVRDKFLDFKMRSELPMLGEWQAKAQMLKNIDAIFNEPSTTNSGIQSVIDEFYGALEELTKTPDELTTRALVRQKGIAICTNLNNMAAKLTKLQDDVNFEIKTNVDQINSYASQIRDLNELIHRQEVDGNTHANDLRDKRNVLLDELSKIAKIDYYESDSGEFTVLLEGSPLVSHFESYELETVQRKDKLNYTDCPGILDVVWKGSDNTAMTVSSPLDFNVYNGLNIDKDIGVLYNKEIVLTDIPSGSTKADIIASIKSDFDGLDNEYEVKLNGDQLYIKNKVTGDVVNTSALGIDFDADGKTTAVISGKLETTLRNEFEITIEKNLTIDEIKDSIERQLETAKDGGGVLLFDKNDFEVSIVNGMISIKNITLDENLDVRSLPSLTLGIEEDITQKLDIEYTLGKDTIAKSLTFNFSKGDSIEDIITNINNTLKAEGLEGVEASALNGSIVLKTKSSGSKTQLKITPDADPAFNKLGFKAGTSVGSGLQKLNPTSGTLKGIMDMRDNATGDSKGIPYYLHMINTFTDTLMSEFNDIHSKGFGLKDEPGYTDNFFFTIDGMTTKEYTKYLVDNGTELKDFELYETGDEDDLKGFEEKLDKDYPGKKVVKIDEKYYVVDKIKASQVTLSGDISDTEHGLDKIAASTSKDELPGNNMNAHALSNTKHDEELFEWGSPDDFIKSLISNMGVDGQEAIRLTNNQIVVVNQIEQNRQSVSGVSLDEEMTDMIKFQHSFNACSRMITVIDEMLDKVINGLGTVGR